MEKMEWCVWMWDVAGWRLQIKLPTQVMGQRMEIEFVEAGIQKGGGMGSQIRFKNQESGIKEVVGPMKQEEGNTTFGFQMRTLWWWVEGSYQYLHPRGG